MNSTHTHAPAPPPPIPRSVWPEGSVGQHMTRAVPIARMSDTLAQVRTSITEQHDSLDTLHYVYVTDEEERLAGVFSIRELFAHEPETRVSDVCKTSPLYSIRATKSRERAVYMALRHNIKSVPAVDKDHRFLGVVSSDDILRILYREMREDLMHFAGIYEAKAVHATAHPMPLRSALRQRMPWLALGLFGGMLSAAIIGLFEHTLSVNLLLAAYIPLIVYMTNAVALQMTAYIIRDIALENDITLRTYAGAQMKTVFAIAVLLSMLLFAFGSVFHGSTPTIAVISLALFIGILSSLLTGILIPYGFHKMHMDPADASGPVGTIIQDNLSIIIYFTVAASLL